MLVNQRLRLLTIVRRYRNDPDSLLCKLISHPGEFGELGVAIRTPGPSMEQDHTKSASQITGQMYLAATGLGKAESGKDVTIVQHHSYILR